MVREEAESVVFTSGNGGVGKSTISLNTSDLLGRNGHKVLCIDCAPQYGGLTDTAGFTNLLSHDHFDITDVMLERDRTLDEIIIPGDEHDMNFDLIPANMNLNRFEELAAKSQVNGNEWTFLHWEMKDADLWSDYDAIIIDAEAGRDLVVKNAIIATRAVMLPTENSRRGRRSVPGVQDFLALLERGMERTEADISLDLRAVIPNDTGDTNADERSRKKYQEMDVPVTPFEIRERGSMLRESMDNQKTVMEYFEETGGPSSHEQYTLEKLEMVGDIIMDGSVEAVQSKAEELAEDPDVKGMVV